MASHRHKNLNQIKHSPDFVYYDVQLRNHGSERGLKSQQLTFNEQRDTPIINNCSDYKMSIVRFYLDTFALPSLFFQVQNNQANRDLGVYSVSMDYDDGFGGGAIGLVKYLNWIPQNTDAAVPLAPSATANGIQPFSEYYYCHNYQYFINLINTALSVAMAEMRILVPGLLTVDDPFLTWDADTAKATIYARSSHFDSDNPIRVNIYFNRALYSLLSTFNYIHNTVDVDRNQDYRILMRPFKGEKVVVLPNVGIDAYIFSTQEICTVSQWTPISSILFTTNTIPITSTFDSNPVIYIDGNPQRLSNTYNSFSNIITDLVSNEFSMKPDLLYNPTAQYRYIDLENDVPLVNIDINVYFKDRLGIIRQFLLVPGASASLKILFEKKNKVL